MVKVLNGKDCLKIQKQLLEIYNIFIDIRTIDEAWQDFSAKQHRCKWANLNKQTLNDFYNYINSEFNNIFTYHW